MRKIIGKTFEGNLVFPISSTIKNFAITEKGEVLKMDKHSFSDTSYLQIEASITHQHHTIQGIVDLDNLYHNGHHIHQDEMLQDYCDGTPFKFYEFENFPNEDDEANIYKRLKEVFNDEDFEYDDLVMQFKQEWGVIEHGNDIAIIWEEDDQGEQLTINSTNPTKNDIFISIYKAKAFIEVDLCSFLNIQQIDDHLSMSMLRNEDIENIKPRDIELYTGVPSNTISKLKTKIKKEGKDKDKEGLKRYIDIFLFRKHIRIS